MTSRTFSSLQTSLLVVMGTLLLVSGGIAVFVTSSSDVAKTSLVLLGTLTLTLAIFGRLPSRLKFQDWEVEFDKADLDQLLSLVKTEAPEIFESVVGIVRPKARNSGTVEASVAAADKDAQDEAQLEDQIGLLMSGESLTSLVGAGVEFNVRQTVEVAGRGRPPIVDAVVTLGEKSMALEAKTIWNPSVARVVKARLERVLENPSFAGAAVIVPTEKVAMARESFGDSRILVTDSRDPDLILKHLKTI